MADAIGSEFCSETNIPIATLDKWQEELRKNSHAALSGEEQTGRWSSRDKFLIVVETISMKETELSEYCRLKGLFSEQFKQWQDVCQEANGGTAADLVEASRHPSCYSTGYQLVQA